ncbi:MAG TPA: CHAD domain-containing protein, partial [Bryobacteraceae bacterium]
MLASSETRKFAAEHAQKLLGQLAFEINRVTKSRNPESVRDLRVSLRRFSQTLQLFRDFFPGGKMHKIGLRVKKVMRSADELRNFDTTLRLLSKAHRSGSSALRSKLQARRKDSERLLVGLLKRWTERQSSVKWRASLQAAVAKSEGESAQGTRKLTPRLAAKFLEKGKRAARANASPRDLQACRTAARKFRYALELLGPVGRSPLNAWLPDIKRAQTMLGEITDCQAARDLVSSYPAADRFDSWLKKRQRKAANAFGQFWEETFANRVVNAQPKKPPGRI